MSLTPRRISHLGRQQVSVGSWPRGRTTHYSVALGMRDLRVRGRHIVRQTA
jgi:hypothetical protein